jgi:hypothetical protein
MVNHIHPHNFGQPAETLSQGTVLVKEPRQLPHRRISVVFDLDDDKPDGTVMKTVTSTALPPDPAIAIIRKHWHKLQS